MPNPEKKAQDKQKPMTLHYCIQAENPKNHFFQVSLQWKLTQKETLVSLPSWIPGSYMIRDFARHLRSMQASVEGGGKKRKVSLSQDKVQSSELQALAFHEIDKDRWLIDTAHLPLGAEIKLSYEVYAFDRSVRTAYLDDSRAFFNASSLLVCPVGMEAAACNLTIKPPTGIAGARLATGLSPRKIDRKGFGLYFAKDYDELIDCPVEIADFAEFGFEVAGASYRFVITGRHAGCNLEALAKDTKAICLAANRLFEPKTGLAPFKQYVFMLNVLGNGYGGLEHRNSTALICSQSDLEVGSDGYRTLLGLISHEYFHTWHVKRIKPQAFAPYQLDRENYTRLLWIFEGFTSYYDDLLVLRSESFNIGEYLNALAKTITQVQNVSGRKHQSLEASSFYAWTKYYKQDENSPNSIVSYYTKGALVALCIDLSIRLGTKHRRSLDDVMQHLWQHYGRDFDEHGRGLGEEEFSEVVLKASGLDLREEIFAWTKTTAELPLERLLAFFGVSLSTQTTETLESLLGAKYRSSALGIEIIQVKSDSAAEKAGLATGDTIIAVNELRSTEAALLSALRSVRTKALDSVAHSIGKKTLGKPGPSTPNVALLAFRSDALISLDITEVKPQTVAAKLEPLERTRREQRQAMVAWLGAQATLKTSR